MFFVRIAVAALSVGAALAAPVNVMDPKISDVAIPACVPAMVPRVANLPVSDTLVTLKGAAQLVESDIDSLASPIDKTKVIQLASDIVSLDKCITAAKTAIGTAHDTLPSVDTTNTMLVVERVGKKLQSVPELRSLEIITGPLSTLQSSIHGLSKALSALPKDKHFDDLHRISMSLPDLFGLSL